MNEFSCIFAGVEPLKNVQIIVPSAVPLGGDVKLQCLYDMEHNESLYAVKWYLELDEIYRYVPKEVCHFYFNYSKLINYYMLKTTTKN